MGTSSTRQLLSPQQDNFSSRYTYIRSKGDITFYIQNITSNEYASKVIICDTPQEETEFFAMAQRTAALRHENIIGIEKVYCLENKSCGTVASKYMILFPYPFRNIRDERDERLVLQENFSEPELWSILLSVCRTLDYLHSKSIPFSPITAQQILIDKEGLIQLDAHHLVENALFQDNYVSRNKNLRYGAPECKGNRVSYVNLRDIEKYNVYSLGIIMLELLEMRDLVELEDDRREKEILALLINRSTYVSGELRQIIRRLTEERSSSRPSYREIINFIQNQQGTSGVLYQQNQIPTAKKNQFYIDHNSFNLNFQQFNGRPSSNVRMNIPRSSALANGYQIPSFAYNNIGEGIQGSKVRDMGETQIPIGSFYPHPQHVIHEEQKVSYQSYQSDMVENRTGLPNPSNFNLITIPNVPITGSIVNPRGLKMMNTTANFTPVRQPLEIHQYQINSMNFPKQVHLESRINNLSVKPESTESPSQVRQIESNLSPIIDSNFKIMKATSIADDVKTTSPKPSFFTRDSNNPNTKREFRHNFSKTGSIEGFNKIYNDTPENYYEKMDFSDLNNIGKLWLYYEGNFKDGKRFGPGIIFMTNGEKFDGNFINDFAEGRGKFSTLDWKDVQGIWKNGHLISIL